MNKHEYKIYIVGAGISGLIAATVLEKNGYKPVIIEATETVGGRLKTEIVNGYQLDHGFQVLLTAYPAVKKYIDLEALSPQKILPGATIFKNSKQFVIGDPLRESSVLYSTLFTGIGTLSDKIKILLLNQRLKKKTIDDIFSSKEQSTLSYLKDLGFSNAIIDDFFRPFFTGVFLEKKLDTSSRMFEFIYKMFGEGHTVIPKSGIAAIPKQLASNLKHTSFKFNTKVSAVKDGEIKLSNNETIESHFTIVATEPSLVIPNLKNQATEWKSCDTLYFETENRNIKKSFIGLISEKGSLINNIFYPTSINTESKTAKELLSVSVIDNQNLSLEVLIERVKEELAKYCNIHSCTFLKHYHIPMALPNLNQLQYQMLPSETRLTTGICLAGDLQLNGSLNAAMISGEKAALGVVENLSNTISTY